MHCAQPRSHIPWRGCPPASCGSAVTCGSATTRPCSPRSTRPAPTARSCRCSSSTPGSGGPPARRGASTSAAASPSCAEATGGALVIRSGDPADVVPAVAREVAAGGVHVSADTGPYGRRRDVAVERALGEVAAHPDRLALRRRPGPGDQARRHPVPGVHPLRPRLARARLARAGTAPGRRRAGAAAPAPRTCRPHPDLGGTQLPPAGEDAAHEAWDRFREQRLSGYAEGRNLPGSDGDQPALAAPEVRHDPPAHAAGRPRGRGGVGEARAPLHRRAGLAGVLRRRPLAPAGVGPGVPAPGAAGDRLRLRPARRGAGRRLGDRPHRLPDRRRRDAPAAGRGLRAQPGADDRGLVPGQGPAPGVDAGGAVLHAAPGRRRPGEQQPRLAVGRRHRHRRLAVLPGLQPDHPGEEVRPGRRPT